ncbi:cornifelin [Rhinatrema bivittatum]|uniref:cornifelin n=1 Tax=Rhinatrema bivittatum TaxID=194408 RepID=UPI00112E5848|nr:cornifelin [Rhinatrema bivittatum]XP_029432674.1 cornifelin [Rhinatrema bivittatum]
MANAITSQPQGTQAQYSSQKISWNSDVMDCFQDMGICLCGTFIPCILACRVAQDYGECCCLPLLFGTVLAMRTGLRERYHIEGTICNDFLCLFCCGQCTLCQMARELKMRK